MEPVDPIDFPFSSSSDFPIFVTGDTSIVHQKSMKSMCCGLVSSSGMNLIALIWEGRRIKTLPLIDIPPTLRGTFSYLDKTIYVFGIEGKRSSFVHGFDVPYREGVFPRFYPMFTPRLNPHTAVVDGKLFVLGDASGFNFQETGPWGEVFDPKHETWKPLDGPKELDLRADNFLLLDPMMTAVLHAEKKILMSFSSSRDIYAYDVNTETWDVYHRLDYPLPFSGRALAVDRVLYFCSAGALFAYYMDHRLTLFLTFAKMMLSWNRSFDLPSNVHPFLQYMGDKAFALVWKVVDRPLYFVTFDLTLNTNSNGQHYLKASILQQDLLTVPPGELVDLLMLDDLDLHLETSNLG